MIEKLKATIDKYNMFNLNDKILIGVSGGPDSLALLHGLYKLGYNVAVAHINHGLRENANIDEAFVRDFCEQLNIPFYLKSVNLKDKNLLNGMSTEEAGRKVRYTFFNEILKEYGYTRIATAHNANDNVETVLLNMFRGSGTTGLKGIDPIRGNIVRPLLEISREDIEKYCMDNNLSPRHDESNDDTQYTRNKIRREVLPYLEKNINSNIISTITRLSQIVSEEEDYISFEVDKAFNNILINLNKDIKRNTETTLYDEIKLNLKKFNSFANVIKKRIVLKAIFLILGNTTDIEKVHVEDIVKMCANNIGNKFLMPNKNIKVSVNKGVITFMYCT